MKNGGNRGARRSRLLVLVMASALAASLTAPALARPRPAAGAAAPVAIDAPRTTPTADLGVWGDFAPPSDTTVVISQPDGTHFSAALTPAEIGGRLEANGYSVIKGADGWWRYATGVKGSDVLTSDARPGLDAPPAGVAKGAARTTNRWDDGSGGDIRASVLRQLQLASLKAQQQATKDGGPRVFRFPVLMLATWWDASKGETGPQFQPGTDTPDYVRNI